MVTVDLSDSKNPKYLYKNDINGFTYEIKEKDINDLISFIKGNIELKAREMMTNFNKAMANSKLKIPSNQSVTVDKSDPDNLRYIYNTGSMKTYFKSSELNNLINAIRSNR